MLDLSKKAVFIMLFIIEHIFIIQFIFFYHNNDVNYKLTGFTNKKPQIIQNLFMKKLNEESIWHDAPNISIVCRTYGERAAEIFNMFITSFLLFWPIKKWPNVEINLIFDDENPLDHRMATVLAHLPPYPNIYFEKKPTQKTFCSDWQREGYSRQQYSNFYSDIYSNYEYIAIVDTDSLLVAQITPEDFFVNGKPRLIGYNACCTGWLDSIQEAIGIEPFGEFMTGISLPLIIKREHFAPMRQHITQRMKAKDFEEAFYLICSKYSKKYSQFDLMAHYLYMFKRDEYSWHLNDWNTAKSPAHQRRASNKSEIIKLSKPITGVIKHFNSHPGYSLDFYKVIFDYLCTASEGQAGDCKHYSSDAIQEGAKKNMFVDWMCMTAEWGSRGMPSKYEMNEIPWSNSNFTWSDAYKVHLNNLRVRDEPIKNNKKWRKSSNASDSDSNLIKSFIRTDSH